MTQGRKYRRVVIAGLVVVVLTVVLCCWSVVREPNPDASEQFQAAHRFRERLAADAVEVWGTQHVRFEHLRGPDDALELVLRAAEGRCREPVIRLFILNAFGAIGPVKTITCRESARSVTFEVAPYVAEIRAMFPMIPDQPDTRVEFGGVVTREPFGPGLFEKTAFKSRQAVIDYLQDEPRGHQFATPSPVHKRGFRIYAAEHDDRILVIETAACDHLTYRILASSSDGLSTTTMVKWTELGGTFLVCKGDRDLGVLSMQAAAESLGLHPVNSLAQCARTRTEDRCN